MSFNKSFVARSRKAATIVICATMASNAIAGTANSIVNYAEENNKDSQLIKIKKVEIKKDNEKGYQGKYSLDISLESENKFATYDQASNFFNSIESISIDGREIPYKEYETAKKISHDFKKNEKETGEKIQKIVVNDEIAKFLYLNSEIYTKHKISIKYREGQEEKNININGGNGEYKNIDNSSYKAFLEKEKDNNGGKINYSIKEVKLSSDELDIMLNTTDSSDIKDFFKKIVKIKVNDSNEIKISDFFPSYQSIRSFDEKIRSLWKKEGKNTIEIETLDEDKKNIYKFDSENPPAEDTEDIGTRFKVADIKKIDFDSTTKSLKIGLREYNKRDLFFNEINTIKIGDVTLQKNTDFNKSNGFYEFVTDVSEKKDEIENAWNIDGRKTIEFELVDGRVVTWIQDSGSNIEINPSQSGNTNLEQNDSKEQNKDKPPVEGKRISISDNMPKGEYTIGFKATNIKDGTTSMLQGFFDKNIKLVVDEEGKKTIVMYNLLYGKLLYDLRIDSNGEWPESKKEMKGEFDNKNERDQAEFTLPIDDLSKPHKGAVLVGPMGGSIHKFGKINEYTHLNIEFDKFAIEGWKGYQFEEEARISKENNIKVLSRRLIRSGVKDINNNGIIEADELKEFKGKELDLTRKSGEGVKDFIYDIELLKNVGNTVENIRLNSNKISKLPLGVFDKATNLKELDIQGNKIRNLPVNIFEKNTKLRELTLAGNPIGNIEKDTFKNNTELRILELKNTLATEIPNGAFEKLVNLEELYINENNISFLDKNIFANNKKLKSLIMDENKLSKLPSSIGLLQNLEILNINSNDLIELPDELKNLKKLKELHAQSNRLKRFSSDILKNFAKIGKYKYPRINLKDNEISEPLDEKAILSNGKKQISSIDVSYNRLPEEIPYNNPEDLGININSGGYSPQKTSLVIEGEARNDKVKFTTKSDIKPEDLIAWGYGYFTDKKSYKQGLESKDAISYLKSKNKDFKISNRIERERDGVKELLQSETFITNMPDNEISIEDNDMKNGDKYILKKSLYIHNGDSFIEVMSTEFETIANKEQKEKQTKEMYKVPAKIINASNFNQDSMAQGALDGDAMVIKEGDKYRIRLSFKGMNLPSYDNKRGHLLELAVYNDKLTKDNSTELIKKALFRKLNPIDTYSEDGVTYPKTFEIVQKEMNDMILIRVWVDAMNEIGKQTGQKDASQPAIVTLDWNKKEVIDENLDSEVEEDLSSEIPVNTTLDGIIDSIEDSKLYSILEKSNRVYGSNRYETSVAVSKKFFKKAENVVIASGTNNVDALVSSSYAKLSKAPILLTFKEDVPSVVFSELERLKTKSITIIGGESSISSSVEKELKNKGYKVTRIFGKDRYETSTKLAREVMKKSKSKKIAVINGEKEADALSASSLVNKANMPLVMLRDNTSDLSRIEEFKMDEIVVIGGESSISKVVYDSIKTKNKKRIYGSNRFETSLEIAKQSYPKLDKLILSSGEVFIDALSAGAVTSRIGAPVILVNKNKINSDVKSILKNKNKKNIYIIGGNDTIKIDKKN